MQQEMNTGTVLFKDSTIFPEHFRCESDSYSPGWRSVKGIDGCELDRQINSAGWHFFFLAGEYKVTAFGREGQETTRRAITQIQALVKSERFNSFEITRVTPKAFLGFPYTTLSFHMRNIQESVLLSGNRTSTPWKDTRLVAA
jgi:hypothetical protein